MIFLQAGALSKYQFKFDKFTVIFNKISFLKFLIVGFKKQYLILLNKNIKYNLYKQT